MYSGIQRTETSQQETTDSKEIINFMMGNAPYGRFLSLTGMDKEKLITYKKKLEAELALVEKELKTIGRKNPDNPADWEAVPEKMDILAADDNEVADSIESYEENTGILKQLEIRYNELKRALERIEAGTFGICEIGKENIEDEKLEANPASMTCKKHMQSV